MAIVNAFANLNTIDPGVWSGYTQEATHDRIVITDGYRTAVYEGYGLSYNNQGLLSGGVITSYAQYNGGSLAGEFYGFEFPAGLAASYISNNDLRGLFDIVLGGNDQIYGSTRADRLAGGRGDDYIYSNGGDDYILAGDGNDVIYLSSGNSITDGGAGFDWVVLPGSGGEYDYRRSGVGFNFDNDRRGVDADLYNVERVMFDDGTLAFDIYGNAGQAYRIYEAAFDREPDLGGLSYWIGRMDAGAGVRQVAAEFIGSAEFARIYGSNVTNEQFVARLYENILDRPGEVAGYNYWVGQLNSGAKDRATVLADFSESNENKANVYLDDGIWYV